MLVWSRSGRFVVWTVATLIIGLVYIAPLAVILAASLAGQWNGALPSGFTLEHYQAAGSGASGDAVFASLVTGVAASVLALVSGTWAALALRAQGEAWSRTLGVLFFIPSAVPSVSVGLGLLVAFSQRPLLLNGTTALPPDRRTVPHRQSTRRSGVPCMSSPIRLSRRHGDGA